MKKPKPTLFAVSFFSAISSLSLLVPGSVSAQTPAAAPVAAPIEAAPAAAPTPPEGAPPVIPADAPAAVPALAADGSAPVAAPLPVEERLANLEGKAEGAEESLAATKSVADKLSKIKVSGYIQGRYEWHGDSTNYGSGATNQFLVRRGRVKTVYDGTNAEYLLQIDAASTGVTLKDAEATFVDTWTPLGLRLTMGQFKWPFGYEVTQSSGDREMPERAAVIRAMFPGERDRGVRLSGKYEALRFAFAIVNGNGTSANNDLNGFKDVVGRVGVDMGWIVGGLSGYLGHPLTVKAATAFSSTGKDTNADGKITADEVTFTAAAPASYTVASRKRIGADAQTYLDVPGIGGFALKGEAILSKDTNLALGATAADPCKDVTSFGWILTASQNIGDYLGIAARVDSYDPLFSKSLSDACRAKNPALGTGDRKTTYAGGVLIYPSGNIKGTLIYEHVDEQNNDVKNDVFTAQLQARF